MQERDLEVLKAVSIHQLDKLEAFIEQHATNRSKADTICKALAVMREGGAQFFCADTANNRQGFWKAPQQWTRERKFAEQWHAGTYTGTLRPDPEGCELAKACAFPQLDVR